jgi:hypothetical protein
VHNGKKKGNLWICGESYMKYKNKDLARKCEKFCKKNKSCSLDIIKYTGK